MRVDSKSNGRTVYNLPITSSIALTFNFNGATVSLDFSLTDHQLDPKQRSETCVCLIMSSNKENTKITL
ncbi:CLUMA_CG018619, isoform A [Clunio marinus]|uniref:CLUMA_CG018619, isoform A n=1 Tax=Clunio marinus TaxID=568069 RepID=A0A1J1IZ40_9DIPT|nr:CLUMA_CG018619, isoform A [Clunio marinus]